MPDSPQLHGWKQIAAYLGVSIRTAQSLEKERALPVHRGPGPKSPVFAFPEEIDAWRALASRTPALARPRWTRRAAIAVPAVLGVAGIATAFHKLRWRWAGLPGSCRIQGHVLIVYDHSNSELWRFTFPEIMIRPGSPCVFADLDGRGRRETLLIYAPVWTHPNSYPNAYLVCFGPDGSRRWTFYPGKTVADGRGRQFSPPYIALEAVTFRPRGSKREIIAVISVHNYSFPSQLAILDGATGKVTAEYWHRGHLNHLATADLDGDGEPEILAGGVIDAPEYAQATLLVFDHRHVSGATPDPSGRSYFPGIPAFSPRHTVFFAKSPVAQRQEFNRVRAITVQPDRILIEVAEGVAEAQPGGVVYELDYRLCVRNVTFDDALLNRLADLQRRGEIPREPPQALAERLKQNVRIL